MRKAKDSRWTMLSLSVVMLLAGRYCFELPAALKELLGVRLSGELNTNQYEFFYNSFLSIYSLPNIVLPLLNGYIVDRFGYKLMLIICAFLALGGHTMFCMGLNRDYFEIMLAGRFLFGVGSESMFVVQNIFLTKIFSQKELSLAMGISGTMSCLGNVLNMLVSPRLATKVSLDAAVWSGVVLCGIGFVSIIIVLIIDRKNDSHRLSFNLMRQKPDYDMLHLEVNHFKKFDRIFWYMALTQFFMFSSIICWVNIGPSLLIEEWFNHLKVGEAQILADNCLALIWLIAVISGPLVGSFADNYGLRPRILLVGTAICTVSMLMFLFVFPFIPSFLLGIAYAFGTSSIFPCISYVIPREYLGKANGLVISMQNLGYFVYPYIIASLKVWSGDYTYAQIFLILSAALAFKFAWNTFKENLRKGYNLEVEVDMMDLAGLEVLALKGSQEQGIEMDYNILHSDERRSSRSKSYL